MTTSEGNIVSRGLPSFPGSIFQIRRVKWEAGDLFPAEDGGLQFIVYGRDAGRPFISLKLKGGNLIGFFTRPFKLFSLRKEILSPLTPSCIGESKIAG